MRIAVVGCGYVGLATGVVLAHLCNKVSCLDTDRNRILVLQNGKAPFLEPGLEELLAILRPRLSFTSDYADAIPRAQAVFFAVGTPPADDGSSDLSQLWESARTAGQHIGVDCRVLVVRSTVPPGTGGLVRELVMESYRKRTGRDFPRKLPLVSNPEFLREGSALRDAFYPERIIAGADEPEGLEVVGQLYRPLLEQSFPPPRWFPRPRGLQAVPLVTMNRASAELTKYAANVFLATKVSFINEIGCLAERLGADVTQVAEGMGLDPRIGSRFLQAGIGWGGPCLGKDLSALLAVARAEGTALRIAEATKAVNEMQRQQAVATLKAELGTLDGRTVTLLGLAFKPHTDEVRDAPALHIAARLLDEGAVVKAHDPAATDRARSEHPWNGIIYCADPIEAVRDSDAVVLATEWPEYRSLPWTEVRGLVRNPLVLDGRNFLDPTQLQAAGFRYVGIGRFPGRTHGKVGE
ncbi:MAG: UDP-glucose/GDP-mannose dehydrogenase family protein [Bacillota bacterium]|jgi:UDPglucose 6-dehydrogenase